MQETLAVTYQLKQYEPPEVEAAMIIEQEEWHPTVNVLSAFDMVSMLGNYYFNLGLDFSIDCGFNADKEMEIDLFVYPYDKGLVYRFYASYGSFTEYKVIDYIEHEQFLSLQGVAYEELEYPCDYEIEHEVLGKVYDLESNEIAPPVFVFEGIYVRTSQPVFAALKVKYRVFRHKYVLQVTPREDAEENYFSSVVYGVYDGGVEWLEVDPVPDADKYGGDAECSFRTEVEISPDRDPPIADPADRYTKYDYCSGDQISDEYTT